MPVISIIMPLYNKVSYVKETISSVLAQTFKDWELWVIENGSTDGGDQLVQQYSDPRIQILSCSERTGGPGLPRNTGLKQAQGHWVCFLDADDLVLPDHLINLLSIAQNDPDIAIVAGAWQEFSEDSPNIPHIKQPAGYPEATLSFRQSTISGAPWACHAALVRRDILQPPYLWVEELDPYLSEDTAFWFRLLTCYSVVYSSSQGALYRRLPDSRDQHLDPERWFQGIHAVIENNLIFLKEQNLPLTANHCEAIMRRYSDTYHLARSQEYLELARHCLELAQTWLDRTISLGGGKTLALQVRSKLGLKYFLPVQHWKQFR